jgi:uncharacterized glyoxalase superfamily protein PhnB
MFTPWLFYERPKTALKWLEEAFGFEVTMLVETPGADEHYIHAELAFEGQGRLIVGGLWAEWVKSPCSLGNANTQSVQVEVPSGIDAHCERARKAGATVTQEPQDQFYGARTYRCVDLEGHHWTFSQHVKKLSVAEMEQAGGVTIKASR